MTGPQLTIGEVAEAVLAAPRAGHRRIVALAGAPASGKSTLAAELAGRLCEEGCQTQVVPMDGFHLHNQILVDRGLLDRKGAPETFDVQGLLKLVARLHSEAEVFYPTFDRTRDIAIASAGVVGDSVDTVIVEGNYLLYDAPVWCDLRPHWDLAIRLEIATETLRERLIDRWLGYGMSHAQAEARAAGNDLANAALITQFALAADISL